MSDIDANNILNASPGTYLNSRSHRSLIEARVVLTPNNRLADFLRDQLRDVHCEAKVDSQDDNDAALAISVPTILPYQTWLNELYAKALVAGYVQPLRLLTAVEEVALWQALIEREGPADLLAPALAAAEAQRANQLLDAWGVDLPEHAFEFSSVPDCAIFYSWVEKFRQELGERDFASIGDVQSQLVRLSDAQLSFLYDVSAGYLFSSVPASSEAAAELSDPIVMLGFFTPTPLQQQLISRLAHVIKQKAHVLSSAASDEVAPPVVDSSLGDSEQNILTPVVPDPILSQHLLQVRRSITVADFESFDVEMKAAANWAKAQSKASPRSRIAIVIPNLATQKKSVERIMEQVFSKPCEEESAGTAASMPAGVDLFNISAGSSLANLPMVDVFLKLVESSLRPLSTDEWQSIIFSPYLFARHESLGGRNLIVQAIYESGEAEFKLEEMNRLVGWFQKRHHKNSKSDDAVGQVAGGQAYAEVEMFLDLHKSGNALLSVSKRWEKAAPSLWMQRFRALCAVLGWPGGRGLDSDEYQQHQAFVECASLVWQSDELVGDVNASVALKLFRQQLQHTIYHKQSVVHEAYAPVQVLGVLEASGQLFDSLWIAGLSDRVWPVVPKPNALIPFGLQARSEMPGASENKEFAVAKAVTQSLLTSARHLRLSYLNTVDGVDASLSPIVSGCLSDEQPLPHDEPLSDTAAFDDSRAVIVQGLVSSKSDPQAFNPFEYLDDFYGQPYPALVDSEQRPLLRRGVSMLQDYALNPMQAYAKHRLALEPLPKATMGLTALERGNVIHGALEYFWRAIPNSDALADQGISAQAELIEQAVMSALGEVNAKRYRPLGARLLDLQQQVFVRLLGCWINLEKERPSFSVLALEQSIAGQVGDYLISGRIDRIDRLANGELLFIDYKTGSVSTSGWLDERVSSPQLPFYLLAARSLDVGDEHGSAYVDSPQMSLAFACLKPGSISFYGLTEADTQTKDIAGIEVMKPAQLAVFGDMNALREHWQTELLERSKEIAAGFAGLDLQLATVATDGTDRYEPFTRALAAVNAPQNDASVNLLSDRDGGARES
jgi:probable DNA repair protein